MATRIPINKDSYSFEDRQKKIWEDMEKDMERRRREWEDEINKMRTEFFLLNPDKTEFPSIEGSRSNRLQTQIQDSDDGKPVIEKDEHGQPIFRVRFNMKEYKPEEINVKMDNTKIMVSARHEEKGTGSSVSREYSREVNVPRDVDPLALSCTLNPDGYLVFHAPLPAPNYSAIKDTPSPASQVSPGVVKSSTSYQSSTINRGPTSISNSMPTPIYAQREQQQLHNQQQQQQQSRIHSVSQQPPKSVPSYSSTQASSYNQSETIDHPDHVVPSYKPPPDLSRYDVPNNQPAPISSQIRVAPSLHSAPPPSHFSTASSLAQSSPFTSLGTTFPTGPISSQAQLSTPVVTTQDGKFQLTMPIDDFKPEELTVKTQDGKVIICAKRQIMQGNTAKTTEMSREHSLPDNVDPLSVKAFFTDTNKLIVEAPFKRS